MVRIICKGSEDNKKFFFDNDMGEPLEIDAECVATFAYVWLQDDKLKVTVESDDLTIFELLP